MDPIIGMRNYDDLEGARLSGRGRLPLPTSCAVTAPPVVAAPAAAVPPAAAALFSFAGAAEAPSLQSSCFNDYRSR